MYRYSVDNAVTYTSEDLVLFKESPFAAFMERLTLENPQHGIPPDAGSQPPRDTRIRQDEIADTLQAEGRSVVNIDWDAPEPERREATLDAMRRGVDFIVNGQLALGSLSGSANLLMRTSGYSELGEFLYIPCDTQSKTTVQSAFRLCFLADLLHSLQGQLPPQMMIIRGGSDVVPLKTDDHIYHYSAVKQRFMNAQRHFRKHRMPDPAESSHFGRWGDCANEVLRQRALSPDAPVVEAIAKPVPQPQRAVGAGAADATAYDAPGMDPQAAPELDNGPFKKGLRVSGTLADQARALSTEPQVAPADVSRPPAAFQSAVTSTVTGESSFATGHSAQERSRKGPSESPGEESVRRRRLAQARIRAAREQQAREEQARERVGIESRAREERVRQARVSDPSIYAENGKVVPDTGSTAAVSTSAVSTSAVSTSARSTGAPSRAAPSRAAQEQLSAAALAAQSGTGQRVKASTEASESMSAMPQETAIPALDQDDLDALDCVATPNAGAGRLAPQRGSSASRATASDEAVGGDAVMDDLGFVQVHGHAQPQPHVERRQGPPDGIERRRPPKAPPPALGGAELPLEAAEPEAVDDEAKMERALAVGATPAPHPLDTPGFNVHSRSIVDRDEGGLAHGPAGSAALSASSPGGNSSAANEKTAPLGDSRLPRFEGYHEALAEEQPRQGRADTARPDSGLITNPSAALDDTNKP
ncbi:hypothetical protein [Parahalioglobus pacificus]|nr:hypothetical protein [Halioglobus pacificus]